MKLKLKDIMNVVNNYYGLDIREKTRKRRYADARHIFIYLSRLISNRYSTPYTHKEISNYVGLLNHSSSILSIRKIDDLLEFDSTLKEDLDNIISILYNYNNVNLKFNPNNGNKLISEYIKLLN